MSESAGCQCFPEDIFSKKRDIPSSCHCSLPNNCFCISLVVVFIPKLVLKYPVLSWLTQRIEYKDSVTFLCKETRGMNLSKKQNDQQFSRKFHSLYFTWTKLGKGQARGKWESSRGCSRLCPYLKKNQKIQDRGWTAVWYHRVSIQPWEIQAASVPELVVNLACIYLAHFLFTVPQKEPTLRLSLQGLHSIW